MRDRRFLDDLWRDLAGLPPRREIPFGSQPDAEALARTEWSPGFESLMRNRLVLGAYRYGLMGSDGKPAYDRVPDMIDRLRRYRKDGNLEHLVDVANLAMLEFVEGRHPRRHFASLDDTGHTREMSGK